MSIFIQSRRVVTAALLMFMAVLLAATATVLSPLAPSAQADNRWSEKMLLQVIGNSEEACRELRTNPSPDIGKVLDRTRRKLGGNWDDAMDLTALTIISYCPQYHVYAPARAGIHFDPWALIPVNSPEQPLMLAYWQGRKGCAIARSQGVHEAVRVLSIPDLNTQAYGGVGINEAKKGMIVAAVMFCKDQLGPVRAYLGG